MDTFSAIAKRKSVREYLNKPIERKVLEKLIDAGRRAPSARAVEPWEFVIVEDKAMLKKISGIASTGSFIKNAACCIVVFCKDTKYYLEDGCAATENILIAAADLGIGTCWVAGDKKPYVNEMSKLLNTPKDARLISLISVGWPKEISPQSKNRSQKEVTHWEKF